MNKYILSFVGITLCILTMISCSKDEDQPFPSGISSGESVVINGVRWATCNVDAPGNFAASPESSGKFYQWNRKKAWSAIGNEVSGWDNSMPTGRSWASANDPSPSGYRVPALVDIQLLLDENYVLHTWTTLNGVYGEKFTDKNSGNSIFLPAAGSRRANDGGIFVVGENGFYWGNESFYSTYNNENAYNLYFRNDYTSWVCYPMVYGGSVRSVAE